MQWLSFLTAVTLVLRGVDAKAVFAHFMVSNSVNYTSSDWEDDIHLAQEAHIDAFAMNFAYDQGDEPQIATAFSVAESKGFKLLFSFDYAGNGPWPQDLVIGYINQYKSSSAYFNYQ
ncbi:hypothetical protein PRZ48_003382 [Zasmidium cellare]|uniref:Glycosyl hydrolase family 71 protein n=1 Tax=Zasmidium cellare TaxID=395010 RepID=A0ABR0EUX0_ZASCE|nr:hypothetical protein PRZ48_003382 [Zasmidium cellare]